MSKQKKIQEEEVGASGEVPTLSDQEKELEKLIQEEEVQSLVIDSEESAKKFYKDAKYKAPEGVNFAYVTSDKNVFWPSNGGSAKAHAFQNKLQIFQIELNGLIESND